MNKKIPCGGFELDDSLTLDSEKKLSVNWDRQVQSDWEQNNENASDYIKNRLCYEEMGIVYITWNGYTGGRVGEAYNQDSAFWKVSDNIYTKEELIGQSFTFKNVIHTSFTTVEITEDKISDNIAQWLNGVKGFVIYDQATNPSPEIAIITEVTTSATLTPGLYFSGSRSLNANSNYYVSKMTTNGVIVHQLDSKYIPGTTYWVRLGYDGDNDKYIVDKSYDDIKMAIDDGKYVVLYDPEEHYVLQLARRSSNFIAFSRVTPYLISQVEIESDNAVSCDEIDLEGSKNWLCSYNDDGLMTSVESLEYIKLKSPNGTLYTISVTDDGTIQAQVKP